MTYLCTKRPIMKTYYKPQHEVFIRAMLTHGDRIKAYREAYPDISTTAVRQAANRLMNHPYVKQRLEPVIEQAKAEAMQQLEQVAGQRIADDLLSTYEQRLLLAQIVRGEIALQRHIKLRNRVVTVEQDLDAFVVLKAIELDTRLEAGYYWPASGSAAAAQMDSIARYLCSQNRQGVGVRKHIETDCPPNPPQAQYLYFPKPPFVSGNRAY